MIKPTLAIPLAACLLAMACTQAIAAPNPYSLLIVSKLLDQVIKAHARWRWRA